ncbi:MAG: VCBS repeat-containing protein [Gemmatimonadetes bacterium]|nr:VCBS repeat-containing protein [Gemmatimonadota bacterium]
MSRPHHPALSRAPRAVAPLVALVAVLFTAACGPNEPGPWQEAGTHRWRTLDVRGGRARFTSVAERAGIRFTNSVSDTALVGNRMLAQGAGIALGDVDGDGRVDVFLGRTEGCSALYRNLGAWRFEDVTAAAGVGACDRHTSAVALVDLEGDADLDLLLLATTGPNAIFVNDGRGRFTERRDLGLDPVGRGGAGITAADVDGDGWLEVYVANYKAYTIDDSVPPQRRAFNQMVREVAPDRWEVVPEHQREYKVVYRPDIGGLRMTQRAAPDAFYRNVRGTLVAEAQTGGRFIDTTGRPLAASEESFTLAARFGDLDADGAPDLYVANDFEDPDILWRNDGRGTFRMADWRAIRQQSNASMSIEEGDVDGDGRPDVFVSDMLAADLRQRRTQIPTHTALRKTPGDAATVLQQQKNSLYLNRGDGTFAEAAYAYGVEASGWTWGSHLVDVDLDGWQDLLVVNGHLWDLMDADVQEGLQNRLNEVPWQRLRWEFPRLALPNLAFRNAAGRGFESMGEAWRFGTEPDVSHAIASADLDGDGDRDVVINRLGAPALVLRNDTDAPRVAVRLVGVAPNTRAIGATVRLTSPGLPLQVREVFAGGLYLSHADEQMTFALGAADSARLEVTWRDGTRTTIDGIRADREYEIRQAGAQPAPPAAPIALSPLFVDVTADLGGQRHQESDFDEWSRQFLIANSLAELGPGVSWYDIDRDGDEDLLVGAARARQMGVFRNDGGRLAWRRTEGPIARTDQTTILGMTDASGTRLLVGMSNWEAIPVQAAVAVAADARGVSTATLPLLPLRDPATGPMALADVDGDGDLDLFVGGRAAAGRYPEPTNSVIYRNTSGRFTLDTARTAVLREVGMVSAALFADVVGDASPDLVLALEWGPLKVFRGSRAGLTPDSLPGLEPTSRWIGLATGDLDGDGRLDLLATSWGRNGPLRGDSTHALAMVYGRLGMEGDVQPILAAYDPRLRGYAPMNSYPRIREAVSGAIARVPTFGAFADSTMDGLLGPDGVLATVLRATTMAHTVFLNRGDRVLSVELPAVAQLAPASGVAIADLDGDGAEDVVLAQNFYPTALGMPRLDAGRGLVLLGDGRGGLRPLTGAASGLLVYGDQRGLALSDYDGDGRLDLALAQNNDVTRLFRNTAAASGLRVRLVGPVVNPDAVGAQVRLEFTSGLGPVREVQAGSGYWSQQGAVQIFGTPTAPVAVRVRWPDGHTTRTPVPAGARELRVTP